MNRDNMLNHLAHTLPHWPTEYTDMTEPGRGWAWYDEEPDCTLVLCKGEEEIREADYLQRRAEVINRPSWNDAPEWAQWLAQDGDGDWWWYECPIEVDDLDEEEWVEEHGVDGRLVRATSGTTPSGHDWRDTLEPRPQAKSDTKTCKHCDVTFQRPRLDSVPDDRCMRCHDEITAIGWDEGEERIDRIAQSDASGDHYAQKSWWTHKPCTLCERQTTAKVSDDRPVCPECVVNGEEEFDASFRVFTEQAFPKQERYQDASGEDWIDEFARTATLEEFRGAMRFTIGKYNRRAGKKDSLISEITKMEDYCRRWREYELARAGQ